MAGRHERRRAARLARRRARIRAGSAAALLFSAGAIAVGSLGGGLGADLVPGDIGQRILAGAASRGGDRDTPSPVATTTASSTPAPTPSSSTSSRTTRGSEDTSTSSRAKESSSTTTMTEPSTTSSQPSTTSTEPSPTSTSQPSTTTSTTPEPTTTTTADTRTPPPASGKHGASKQEREVLRLVNVERVEAGCDPVSWNDDLSAAAAGHSADMAANDYFSHTSLDGRSFADRIRATGYDGGTIGENIAAGQDTPAEVMEAWMNSEGHRANILNCAYRHLGVGLETGGSMGTYWTQDFGG